MPRPKPTNPKRPHAIRLTDNAWAAFQLAGGAPWLERTLRKARFGTQAIADRNARITADWQLGVRIPALATRYGLSENSIYRIINAKT